MDTFFWVILIVVAVGVVWWLLNRSNTTKSRQEPTVTNAPRSDGALSSGGAAPSAEAAGTTGIATAAGFGRPAEPAAPTAADEPAAEPAGEAPRQERSGAGSSAATPANTADAAHDTASKTSGDEQRHQDQAEWETQWSEAGGPSSATAGSARASHASPGTAMPPVLEGATEQSAADAARPVHHPEYTEPHAPTLPGAETAAVEEADDAAPSAAARTGAAGAPSPAARGTVKGSGETAAVAGPAVPAGAAEAETMDRTQSSALVETGTDHDAQEQRPGAEAGTGVHPETAGHLAAAEPYGAGSAAAGPDGSGPAGFEVKGDAGSMVYYEEGHPDYGQTRADVWFESPAHAEAAGFRAPRRKRL